MHLIHLWWRFSKLQFKQQSHSISFPTLIDKYHPFSGLSLFTNCFNIWHKSNISTLLSLQVLTLWNKGRNIWFKSLTRPLKWVIISKSVVEDNFFSDKIGRKKQKGVCKIGNPKSIIYFHCLITSYSLPSAPLIISEI